MTHERREGQPHDEVKSGGTQPTYIRVIHRRLRACRVLTRAMTMTEKTVDTIEPTVDRSIHIRSAFRRENTNAGRTLRG